MSTSTQTQEDRGTLAKESTAALTTETHEKETIMDQSTKTEATPGFRIEADPIRTVGPFTREVWAELIRRGFVETINEDGYIEYAGPVIDRNTYQIKPVFNSENGFEFFLDHDGAFSVKDLCDLNTHSTLLLKDLGFDITDWASNFGKLPQDTQ